MWVALCGSIPIVVTIINLLVEVTEMAEVGTPDHNKRLPPAFTPYEPHHDPGSRQASRSLQKPTHPGPARHTESQTRRDPQRYGTRRPATPTSSIRHLCATWMPSAKAHLACPLCASPSRETGLVVDPDECSDVSSCEMGAEWSVDTGRGAEIVKPVLHVPNGLGPLVT